MESRISKIIDKNTDFEGYVSGQASTEIANIFSAFIDWIANFAMFDILADKQYIVEVETHVQEAMTLDELFNYWWDNVKDK